MHLGHSTFISDNKIYFTLRDANIIGIIDTVDKKIEYILGPTEESFFQIDLYGGISAIENKMILTPYNASKMWIYDIKEMKWDGYDIPWYGIGDQDNQFTGTYILGNKIFMFGDHAKDIYVFDINKREGEYILDTKSQLWGGSFASDEDNLYIGLSYTDKLLVLKKNNNEQIIYDVPGVGRIGGVQICNDTLWLSPRNMSEGDVVVMSKTGDKIDNYHIPHNYEVLGSVSFGKQLLLYGFEMPTISFDMESFEINETDYNIFMATNYNDYGSLAVTHDGNIIHYTQGNINKYEIEIGEEVINDYYDANKYNITNLPVIEVGSMNLNHLIRMVVQDK